MPIHHTLPGDQATEYDELLAELTETRWVREMAYAVAALTTGDTPFAHALAAVQTNPIFTLEAEYQAWSRRQHHDRRTPKAEIRQHIDTILNPTRAAN